MSPEFGHSVVIMMRLTNCFQGNLAHWILDSILILDSIKSYSAILGLSIIVFTLILLPETNKA